MGCALLASRACGRDRADSRQAPRCACQSKSPHVQTPAVESRRHMEGLPEGSRGTGRLAVRDADCAQHGLDLGLEVRRWGIAEASIQFVPVVASIPVDCDRHWRPADSIAQPGRATDRHLRWMTVDDRLFAFHLGEAPTGTAVRSPSQDDSTLGQGSHRPRSAAGSSSIDVEAQPSHRSIADVHEWYRHR